MDDESEVAEGSGEPYLEVSDLAVEVDGTPVLDGVELTIRSGEVHVLFGPNGCGKSSLLASIMGVGPFQVVRGDIRLFGDSAASLAVHERARAGLGMAFQGPPVLRGVRVGALAGAMGAAELLGPAEAALDLEGFRDRSVNVGFSGGETKRWEICKLFLQRPRLLLLDEPEGGVDLDHVGVIAAAIRRLVAERTDSGAPSAALVVSHTGSILDRLDVDVAHLMLGGRIVHSGDPAALFEHITTHGYQSAPG